MASLYPTSTTETLIVPVSHLGFTPLGKALSPTFVLTTDNKTVAPPDFGIDPSEWHTACEALSQALHASELSPVLGILQWVPLVVFAGPMWINMRAEQKQRTAVYMELAQMQKSILRPRNLQMQ